MRPVCEVMTRYIPAFRATIARELIEKYGMNQAEIAKRLGVSQPAVSQYLSNVRGTQSKIVQHPKVNVEIKNFCQKISENDGELQFCDFCKVIRSTKAICPSCKPNNSECTRCVECF